MDKAPQDGFIHSAIQTPGWALFPPDSCPLPHAAQEAPCLPPNSTQPSALAWFSHTMGCKKLLHVDPLFIGDSASTGTQLLIPAAL